MLEELYERFQRYTYDTEQTRERLALDAVSEVGISPIIDLARTDTDPEKRSWGVYVLGLVGDEDGVPTEAVFETLAGVLVSDAVSDVRASAALALGDLDLRSSVAPLVAALTEDAYVVRVAAARGLGRVGADAGIDPLSERLQDDPRPEVREAAANALGSIGGEAVLQALEKAKASDASDVVRAAAAEAYGRAAEGNDEAPGGFH